MGKVDENIITKGFRGKYNDDLVFRRMDKQTVFSRRSVSTKPPTASQLEARNRFNRAAHYASAAIAHPQRSLDYKLMATLQGLKSSYLAAVTDYLTLPEITSVFTDEYNGNVGDIITITARVPFKITEITVSLLNTAATVLESGRAVPHDFKWRYIITTPVKGSKFVLLARDRQGKEVTFEKSL